MIAALHLTPAQYEAEFTDRGQRAGADVGNPMVRAMGVAGHAGTRTGIWESVAGGWPIVDREDTEICLILDGEAQITDAGTARTLQVSAGDLLVLPIGWSGRWDVPVFVRKFFVILPEGATIAVEQLSS